jgi:hypothetical protein
MEMIGEVIRSPAIASATVAPHPIFSLTSSIRRTHTTSYSTSDEITVAVAIHTACQRKASYGY